MAHLVGDLLRNKVTAPHIRADDLNIDGCGQAEVQDLGNDIGRLEEKLHSGKALRQYFAQVPHQSRGRRMMLRVERDQNLGVAGANGPIRTVGLVDTGVGQPDVVENCLQLTLGNLLAQRGFNFVTEFCGLFDAQPGTGAHMEAKLASVYLRKEVLSQEKEQPQREQAKGQEEKHEDATMLERGFEQRFVAAAEVFKLALKAALEASEK